MAEQKIDAVKMTRSIREKNYERLLELPILLIYFLIRHKLLYDA
jgi:hypothetical protein